MDDDDDFLYNFIIILSIIVAYNNCRNRHRLTKEALVHPTLSPFNKLINCGNDSSFLDVLGFNKPSFRLLSKLIYSYEELKNIRTGPGRPNTLTSCERLGVLIMYLSSNLKTKHLSLIFGASPTIIYRTIKDTLYKVFKILKKHPASKINFPNQEKLAYLANLVQLREPSVSDVALFVDVCLLVH